MPRLSLLALALLFGGCLTTHPRVPAPPTPLVSPEAFFLGKTVGQGTLTLRGGRPRVVRVQSRGVETDTAFVLRQTIRIGDDPPSERAWTMRRTGPNTWTGTLTDASGPIEVTASGARLRIRYRMGWATTMDQELTLQPDGRTLLNLSTVRVLGIPWARLVEWIERPSPMPAVVPDP